MLKNYLKTAFRNLVKHKGYSFINISGLALGIACCLLIMLYVKDEVTFDRFHEKGENIYRVRSNTSFDKDKLVEFVSMPVGPTVKEEIPAVVNQSRYVKTAFDIRIDGNIQNQGKVFYVESEFLEMFDFPNKFGDALSVLKSNSEIAITEKVAKRIFGKKMAIGESMDLNIKGLWKTYTIGAILKDVPSNSSIDFEMLVPFQTYLSANNRQSNNIKDWFMLEFTFQTFIQILPNTDIESLTKSIDELAMKKMVEMPQYAANYNLQPLTNIHFDASFASSQQAGMRKTGDRVYSKILASIALLVLLLACINFTNLSLARALPRAKEIGVRKVVGAKRKQLITQFLGEAFLMSTTAFLLGLLLAELVLPAFELAAQKEFSLTIIDSPVYVLIAFMVVSFSAFVAGAYPALVISKFKTVSALKGNFDGVSRKGRLQKFLIVLQFSVAGFLIIGVLTMNRQINFLVNMDRGYDDTNLLSVRMGDLSKANLPDSSKSKGQALLNLLRNDLSQSPTITHISGNSNGYSQLRLKTNDIVTGEPQTVLGNSSTVDADYFKAMGVTFLAGRDFKKSLGQSEKNSIVVNESYAELLNLKDSVNGGIGMPYGKSKIIGIVKDFNLFSLTREIVPTIFALDKRGSISSLLIKFEPETLTKTLSVTEAAWNKLNSNNPFDYTIIEVSNASQFREQKRWQSIILTASLIAICISCLGLFGLAYMSTQRRVKEIGIRKVFGAPVPTIVYVLSRGFAILILVSLVIASPLAYYAGENWLTTFPYRIEMNWDLFFIAALVQLSIAIVTVSVHAVKAAMADPVKALKYE